jgi:hypothetical protein
MRRAPILGTAAALCLLLGASACSGNKGPSKDEMVDDLSKTLQADGGFDEDTADCYAKIVVDEVGVDEMKDINLTADEPSDELQDAIAAATVRARDECDLAGDPG